VQRLSQVHGKPWQISNDDSGSKVLSGVIPLTIKTPFPSRDAIFLLELLWLNPPFFCKHSEWCFFELVIEVETSQKLPVKSSLELCWIWIRKLHPPLDTLKRWIPSERSTTHHFQIGSHFDFDWNVIFETTNTSWQAIYVRTMPFQPLEFCHIPNESWVWKRKLYLCLKKKLTYFWVSIGSSKSSVGVTVSTMDQILRKFPSNHLRSPKKKGMEKKLQAEIHVEANWAFYPGRGSCGRMGAENCCGRFPWV